MYGPKPIMKEERIDAALKIVGLKGK